MPHTHKKWMDHAKKLSLKDGAATLVRYTAHQILFHFFTKKIKSFLIDKIKPSLL